MKGGNNVTYQMARPVVNTYGRNNTVRTQNMNNYRPARNNVSPKTRRAEALSREEILSIRSAEMRRRNDERRRMTDAEEVRRAEMRRRQYERDLARTKAYEAEMKRQEKEALKAEKARRRESARLEAEAIRRNEIKIERQKMPWQFILSVAIAFTLLLAMVFSFAQISESNRELAEIKSQISASDAKADKLKLQLEEKNDLNMIEKIAIEEYNMVKEGSVQKKYVSLSEGDRVVLENVTEEENGGFMSGMMSSAASMFDDLLDYIK